MTVAEARALLERGGVASADVASALDQVMAGGYLDDGDFARRFTEDRRRLDRWGSERIARELERRGVAPQLVEEALDGHDREAELAGACDLLAERVPCMTLDDRGRSRAFGLLGRRGYEAEIAYEAIRRHERRARALEP